MRTPVDAATVPCHVAPDAWAAPEPGEQKQAELAKHLCRTQCPIVDACAEHGIRSEARGIYGGLSPDERRRIRSRRGIVLDTPDVNIAYVGRRVAS